MAEQPITREWLEKYLGYCSGPDGESLHSDKAATLLQWARDAMERERRLREALGKVRAWWRGTPSIDHWDEIRSVVEGIEALLDELKEDAHA